MAIEVQCEQCHKRYRVADTAAGKRVKCKACGAVMQVPAAGPEEEDPFGEAYTVKDWPDDPPMAPPPTGPASIAPARPAPVAAYYPSTRKNKSTEKKIMVGGIAGGGVIGVLVVILRVVSIVGRSYHNYQLNHQSRDQAAAQQTEAEAAQRRLQQKWDAQQPHFLPAPDARPAPAPDWNNVPPASSSEVKPLPNLAPKQRMDADGKPIPPPPVDLDERDLHPIFGDEGALPFRRNRVVTKKSAAADPQEMDASADSVLTFADIAVLAETDALKAPARPSPFVFAHLRGEGKTAWQRYALSPDSNKWEVTGKILLKSDGGFEQPIISPSGEYLVRTTGFKETIEVYSFSKGDLIHTIDGRGMKHFVGFTTDDQFVVSGGPDRSMLAIVSCKTGQKVRDLISPVGMKFEGQEVSISRDGTKIAVPVEAKPQPLVLIYSSTGGIAQRIAVPVPPAPPGHHAFFGHGQASAFSEDGKHVAAMYQEMGEHILYLCDLPAGKVTAWHQYSHLDFSLPPFWSGVPAMRFLADTDCVLLRDSIVLDTVTGRTVGRTASDVDFFHEFSPGKYLIRYSARGGKAEVCTLDRDGLKDKLAVARAAGPLQSGATAAAPAGQDAAKPNKFAANGLVPKKGDAKLGAPLDPAPGLTAKVVETPIAIESPYSQIRQVLFNRSATPAAVIWSAPAEAGRSETAEDAALQRIDLVKGTSANAIHIPPDDKLLGIDVAGTRAVVSGAAEGAMRIPGARLSVLSLDTGKVLSAFQPYADLTGAGGGRGVSWAALPDDDGLLTLNTANGKDTAGGKVLVRWSLSGRKAQWARDDVLDELVLTPGGKYLCIRQAANLLLLDTKSGEALGSLAAAPLAGAQIKHAEFSPDGATFLAATNLGVVRWDVKTGACDNDRITTDVVERVEPFSQPYALLGDRLFDLQKRAVIFSYPVYGGRHAGSGPADRQWYIARSAGDGAPYLCSAKLPAASDLSLITQLAANPPLIRPGTQIALQISAGPANEKITQALAAKLKARHLDQGDIVATLRVSAQQRPDAEEVKVTEGFSPFNQRDTGQRVHVVDYECFYELVDAKGKVLYGSQLAVFREQRNGVVMHTKDETIQQKIDEQLQHQIENWGMQAYIPTYMTAAGTLAPRPESVLKVNLISQ